ncbi:MAG: hypothetical protein ACUVTP_04350 [Candidatus Fervidibacter sp.]|uniref:hypothetical protein n=1 Tax=Candidatus Fervidibacter sp. TaxID=3100871 RepID=UPI00404B4CB7
MASFFAFASHNFSQHFWGQSFLNPKSCASATPKSLGRLSETQNRTQIYSFCPGIQAKGGSSSIRIVRCRLEHAGARAIQLGGSTGLQFFRPPLQPGQQRAEARVLTVEGCTIIGSTAAIAFTGVDGALVRFNTIYRPKKWAFRILQETTAEGFVPCRNGTVIDNLIVFKSDEWAEGGINIGPNTAPQTFTFAGNLWFCIDKPERSKPNLPVFEKGGVYEVDPKLRNPELGDLTVTPDSPASKVGAHALGQKIE